MKTICVDCRYIGPRFSGIGELVRGLVDYIPSLAPDLRFVLLRNPSLSGSLSIGANVREVVVPQAANGPATMWWLPRVVDLSGVDLFHATFNIMPSGLTMPCVTTIHDLMWLTHPRWCNSTARGHIEQVFYRHGIRRALRRSAAIATVSRATREAIIAGQPEVASRTHVTLSGVAADFRPVRVDSGQPAVPNLPAGKRFILVVGQFAPYKNHTGALHGFAEAFRENPELDIVFVQRIGRGARLLTRLAEELGIGGRAHILRSVDRETLVRLYSAAAALLHPSFCEGFGNPVAEAMACGCPVVTSNLSAMPEVAGGAACLVDPRDTWQLADALRRVVHDETLAETMRQRGLARASELQWSAFAAANLSIYRRVLGPYS